MTKTSITRMTVEEIAAYLEQKKQSDVREKHQKALKAKQELGAYCQRKYGLTLQQVFTASDKAPQWKQYKNPQDGSLYNYSGRGKLPTWLKGPDGKPADFEIKYTFGVEPLQQYLIELPGGRLQAFTLAWDSRAKQNGGQRWFALYPNEHIAPGDPLHWLAKRVSSEKT